jgi:hypothetical protein
VTRDKYLSVKLYLLEIFVSFSLEKQLFIKVHATKCDTHLPGKLNHFCKSMCKWTNINLDNVTPLKFSFITKSLNNSLSSISVFSSALSTPKLYGAGNLKIILKNLKNLEIYFQIVFLIMQYFVSGNWTADLNHANYMIHLFQNVLKLYFYLRLPKPKSYLTTFIFL